MTRQVTVFDPFRMLSSDVFDRPFRSLMSSLDSAVDVYEEDDKVVVRMVVPGFQKDDIDINIEDTLLTVSGRSVEKEEENKKRKYFRQEIEVRDFSQTVSLPTKVEADKAKAKFQNGVLEIEIPKAPEVMPKRIPISVE